MVLDELNAGSPYFVLRPNAGLEPAASALPPALAKSPSRIRACLQNLIEYISRQKIYDSVYWKQECFGLSAERLVDKAVELNEVRFWRVPPLQSLWVWCCDKNERTSAAGGQGGGAEGGALLFFEFWIFWPPLVHACMLQRSRCSCTRQLFVHKPAQSLTLAAACMQVGGMYGELAPTLCFSSHAVLMPCISCCLCCRWEACTASPPSPRTSSRSS